METIAKQKIPGYRELSEAELNGICAVKELGRALGAFIAEARKRDLDQRWVSIGETHLQQGLMALTRAIAKPEGF